MKKVIPQSKKIFLYFNESPNLFFLTVPPDIREIDPEVLKAYDYVAASISPFLLLYHIICRVM